MNTVTQTTDIHETPHSPVQAFASDEYDEDRRTGPWDAGGSLGQAHREWKTKMAALRSKWLDDHAAEVAAVQPVWADPEQTWVDMIEKDERPDSIEFSRIIGSVKIEQACDVTGGRLELIGDPDIRVRDRDEAEFTAADASRVGVDMVAAAAVLGEYVTVSELRRTAVAAGVRTGVLLQMTEG